MVVSDRDVLTQVAEKLVEETADKIGYDLQGNEVDDILKDSKVDYIIDSCLDFSEKLQKLVEAIMDWGVTHENCVSTVGYWG
jgi:hypothetical protein